jgi:biotin carboxyl carrier protein
MAIRNCIIFVFVIYACSGCNDSPDTAPVAFTTLVKTPVTTIHPQKETIGETITLNAVSSYSKRNIINTPVTGYINSVKINVGDEIYKGDTLFTILTKEAAALSHALIADSLKQFTGIISIYASQNGIITDIMNQIGDYVQEGVPLCYSAEKNSLIFTLNVPYELNAIVHTGMSCNLILPDQRKIPSSVVQKIQIVDPVSQTQHYILNPIGAENIPENLIAHVELTKASKPNVTTLPKQAILANETLDTFWVMKIINDSTAVKVFIKKGLENAEKAEIVSPELLPYDSFILSGGYGLEDTAFITIKAQQ